MHAAWSHRSPSPSFSEPPGQVLHVAPATPDFELLVMQNDLSQRTLRRGPTAVDARDPRRHSETSRNEPWRVAPGNVQKPVEGRRADADPHLPSGSAAPHPLPGSALAPRLSEAEDFTVLCEAHTERHGHGHAELSFCGCIF